MIINVLNGKTTESREVRAGVISAWIPESVDGIKIIESYELRAKVEIRRIQDYLRDLEEDPWRWRRRATCPGTVE